MPKDVKKPKIGSVWRHENGGEYRVTMFTNEKTTHPKEYPITVIYVNTHNHGRWSRPLADWHRSMREVL